MADFETRNKIHNMNYEEEAKKYVDDDPRYTFEQEFFNGGLQDVVREFALRYINYQMQIKQINKKIKELKQDFALQGLDTRVAIRAIKQIQQEKKHEWNEITSQQIMVDFLTKDKEFDDALTELMAKDEPELKAPWE